MTCVPQPLHRLGCACEPARPHRYTTMTHSMLVRVMRAGVSAPWCCCMVMRAKPRVRAQALCFLFVRRRGSGDVALSGGAASTGSTTKLMHARAADPRRGPKRSFNDMSYSFLERPVAQACACRHGSRAPSCLCKACRAGMRLLERCCAEEQASQVKRAALLIVAPDQAVAARRRELPQALKCCGVQACMDAHGCQHEDASGAPGCGHQPLALC